MNDVLIRKFCASPRRSLIVISATALLGLGLLVPLVDEVYDNKTLCDALTTQLAEARRTEATLPDLETKVGELTKELGELESRAIGEASMVAYRSRLVDVVRSSGCQIRRIQVGPATTRPWLSNDNPLETEPPADGVKTPFVLEKRSLELAVNGGMGEIHNLLQRLEEERVLAHPKS